MLTYSILAYVNKNRIRCDYNTVVSLKQVEKEVNSFQEVLVAISAQCTEPDSSFFTTLQHV